MRFNLSSYDGRLAAHRQAEESGELLLGSSERPFDVQLRFEGSAMIFGGDGLKYPLVASATGLNSCRITMTDRDDPSIGCTFELPKTHASDFNAYYADWQRDLKVGRDHAVHFGGHRSTVGIADSIGAIGIVALIGGVVLFIIGIQMVVHNHQLQAECNSTVGQVGQYFVANGAAACAHANGQYDLGWVLLVLGAILGLFGIRGTGAALMVAHTRSSVSAHASGARPSGPGPAATDGSNRAASPQVKRADESSEISAPGRHAETAPVDRFSAAAMSVADELAKLAKLKADGLLTEDEFAVQKAKLLS